MKQRLLKTIGLALLMVVGASNAWADNSKTITVKDQTTVNGSTVTRTDEVIVAYTNANNAIWYLGYYDLSSISSIDVIGAAFVSNGDEKAELKLAWMDVSSIGEVDTDYLSTNSSTIRSSGKILAKIVAETTPTTIESGKNATHYAGANFNITSSAVTKTGTYAGTVSEGTHQAISKTSGVVHLFVYGTASSRRLSINQIKINYAGTGVYNKTTNVEFSKINDAFNYLTDADTELEVNSDQTLTGRCTWSKAHTLTITPKQDITITADKNNYMWFLVNTSSGGAELAIGAADHSITFDGKNNSYTASVVKRENNNLLTLKNVTFKNINLDNRALGLVHASANNNAVTLDGITIENCKNTTTGFIYNERVVNNVIVLKGYLNLDETSYKAAPAIYTTNNAVKNTENGAININDDSFTASMAPIKIKWNDAPTTIGYGPLVTGIDGLANATDLFDFYDASYGFYADDDNLKLTQAYTLSIGEAGAATLVLPFESTIPTSPSGLTCYKLTYDGGDNITATAEESTLGANKPVLVMGTASTSYKFVSTATSGDAATGSGQTSAYGNMYGNYDASWTVPTTTGDDANYILQNKASGLGFYKVVEDQNTLSPNRAYLSVSHTDAMLTRGFLGIRFGGDITDIQSVENEETGFNDDDAPVYNMSGMLMQGGNLPKGIYVKRGKKFVVK